MAVNADFKAVIEYLERERGVDRETILQAIESSVEQAARKNIRTSNDFTVQIDRKTLEIRAWDLYAVSDDEKGFGILSVKDAQKFDKDVQEGDTVKVPFPAERLGRIAAQTAKQTIMQKIREAERSNVYNAFKDRVGDIVNGTVKLVSRRDVYVELGKTEAVMPVRERIPSESYEVGDPIRAYVLRVQNETSSPAVVLSRACPDFVKTLFRLEVAEINDGIVEVVSVARDPGRRSKVAVRSLDPAVDPVGACVGMRGARVRNIINELNGEKLDIVRYSDSLEDYIRAALSPAEPTTLEIDDDTHKVAVTVPEDKLSLAIGRAGQNVRLASKLTGWEISITKNETEIGADDSDEFEDKREQMIHRLAKDLDITNVVSSKLVDCGFHSIEGILFSEPTYFQTQTELDEQTVKEIYQNAQAIADAKKE